MKFKSYTVQVKNLSSTEFTIQGNMFRYISGNGLYLSSNKLEEYSQLIDLYSNIRLVSAANPPFFGLPLSRYNIVDNNTLNFYLPDFLSAGNYDLIFCNPAGYDKLSNYINIPFSVVKGIFEPKEVLNISGENNILSINGNNIVTIQETVLT